MSFALGTISQRGRPAAAMRIGDRYWLLAPAARSAGVAGIADDLMSLFANWDRALARLKRIARAIAAGKVSPRLSVPAARAQVQTPLQYPRKVFAVGANYADHLAEMNASSIRKVRGVPPFFFLKPPSTALVGPGRTVHIPPGCHNFDWEAEVVVVFGKAGRAIKPRNALAHVAGFTLGIDFTARDLLVAPESFFKFNFVLGKCQDTTSPVGPVIVPAEFVDGEALQFGLWVNEERKQFSSTRHMIYTLAEQIAGVSRAVAIEPGDLMFTGSPAGVGLPRGERLAVGDRVRVQADVIGAMEVVLQRPLGAR